MLFPLVIRRFEYAGRSTFSTKGPTSKRSGTLPIVFPAPTTLEVR
jgi:hypothetical protein